jgi:TonB family protein
MKSIRAVAVVALAALTAVACSEPEQPSEPPTPMPGASPFVYPVELWDQGLEGETMLMVHVTELGQVDSAYVLDSSGFDAFDSAAVDGSRRLQFSAGRRGDLRVAMWTKVPVRFAIDTATAGQTEGGVVR